MIPREYCTVENKPKTQTQDAQQLYSVLQPFIVQKGILVDLDKYRAGLCMPRVHALFTMHFLLLLFQFFQTMTP